MQRITLSIEDRLLRRLKEKAAREGRTLQDTANDLLKQGLDTRPQRLDYRLELEGWDAAELPGVDLLDRHKLLDIRGKS
ncbi:MAG: hypothetical protein OXU26_09695 [Acidobacteriota bacterium]|nr:hypothetical protein [Acidobacteriota bacterium]MDE2964175.1 hypothetical protein [Acidobacteriota bacterium]